MNGFDIVILAVVVVSVLIGWAKGFMRMVLPVAAVALSVYLAYTLASPAANLLEDRLVAPKITTAIAGELRQGRQNVAEAIPSYLKDNAARFGLDLSGLQVDAVSDDRIDETAQQLVKDYIHTPLHKALTGVTTVVLFLLLSVVLGILARLLARAFKKSLFGGFNRLAGGAVGLVFGGVAAAFLCAVMLAVISLRPSGFLIFTPQNADTSMIFRYFNQYLIH